jgi:DNA adenine methylase
MKPVIKWVGGKTQILDDVITLFPSEIKSYYEPFVGGGSVLLELLSKMKSGRIKVHEKVYASDLNENLIYMYKNIQNEIESLLRELK